VKPGLPDPERHPILRAACFFSFCLVSVYVVLFLVGRAVMCLVGTK
jgi:hypothetical protein